MNLTQQLQPTFNISITHADTNVQTFSPSKKAVKIVYGVM
jgi:hypothetical protein